MTAKPKRARGKLLNPCGHKPCVHAPGWCPMKWCRKCGATRYGGAWHYPPPNRAESKRGPRRGWWCRTHHGWADNKHDCGRMLGTIPLCKLRPLYEGQP